MKIRLYNDQFSFEETLDSEYIKDQLLWKFDEFDCLISEIENDHPFAYGYLEDKSQGRFRDLFVVEEFTRIQFIKRPNIKNALWTVLESSCLEEGGDGDSVFVSNEWLKSANEFELWLKENKNDWWERIDYSDYVSFSHDQECIYFSNSREVCPWACHELSFKWDSRSKIQ